MKIGKLNFEPIDKAYELVARPCADFVKENRIQNLVFVAKIDKSLADTAAFCSQYDVGEDISSDCLIIKAKRGEKTWYAACLVLAPDMADINGVVRRHLDARKASFAPKEEALELTNMEYGGVTPLGLPANWPVLIDKRVLTKDIVVIGGGVRGSKMAVKTTVFKSLPKIEVLSLAKG